MEADFATIRDGLRRLREFTSPLKVFGSEAHGFRTHPPLSEKAVREFEAQHRVTLPPEYRGFLIQVGNGGAGPAYGLFKLGEMDDGFGHKPWDEDGGFLAEEASRGQPLFLVLGWQPGDCAGSRTPSGISGAKSFEVRDKLGSESPVTLSSPLIKSLIILAMTSSRSLRAIAAGSLKRPRRRAISRRGTRSCAEPRAIVKKLRRSGLVKRPFPSARLVAIEARRARLSWSTRKP